MIAIGRRSRSVPYGLKRVMLCPITWAGLAPLIGCLVDGRVSLSSLSFAYYFFFGVASFYFLIYPHPSSLDVVSNAFSSFIQIASVFPAIIYASLPLSKAWRPINFFMIACLPLKAWFIWSTSDFAASSQNIFAAMVIFVLFSMGNIACGMRLLRDLRADPFQYSIRSLLGLIAFAAIALGIGQSLLWPWQSLLAAIGPPVFLAWGVRNALFYYWQKPICAALVFHLWRNFWKTFMASLLGQLPAPWSAVLQKSMAWFDPPQALSQWWFVSKSSSGDSQEQLYASLTAAAIWFVLIYATGKFIQIKRRATLDGTGQLKYPVTANLECNKD